MADVINVQYIPYDWSRTVTVKLMGGLGNQLFQRAFGDSLCSRCYNVRYDKSALIEGTHREYSLGYFGDPISSERQDFVIGAPPFVIEKSLAFDESYLEPPDGSTLVGYWQNEKYISSEFRSFFMDIWNRNSMTGAAQRYWKEEIYPHANTISLHIRRKDYLELQHFHGMPTMDYYERAIELIAKNSAQSKVFIFSDDTEWCKENFPKTLKRINGINGERSISFTVVESTNKYEDLRLMASCKHAILANSSFSWWGAFLGDGQSGRKVIAPARWFADETANQQAAGICPDRWIRL